MDRNSVKWSGNFCAAVTPFTESGAIDEVQFRRNLRLLIDEGIDGLVITGHTGESWAVDDEERYRLFTLAVEVSSGRVPVIGGITAIRTQDAIRLAQGAGNVGVEGVMLTAPPYAMVDERETLAHFQAVSDNCELPMLLYNIPRRVGRELGPQLMDRAADILNVVALKQSGPSFDDIAKVIEVCGERILVFAGNSAERGMPAVAVGADGFVSSVETQVLGTEAISLYQLSIEGSTDEARRVQRKCAQLKRFLGQFGTEPAALKVAMNHIGRPGGYPRPPILPLPPDEEVQVRTFMDQLLSVAV